MGFLELPWLIVGCFLRGSFDANHEPDESPKGGPDIVAFVLLAWLMLAGLIAAQVIRRDMTAQHCAVEARAACVSHLTYLKNPHNLLAPNLAGKIDSF